MTPTVTVFGCCRVITPSQMLADAGTIKLNQKNIFGFTHYAAEVKQQIDIITGAKQPPTRLRPYMNIREEWKFPAAGSLESFHESFKDTDVFVLEVSSIRKIIFKAFFLQINRTRELLGVNEKTAASWWDPMMRFQVNDTSKIPAELEGVPREVAETIRIEEQSTDSIYKEIRELVVFLKKPVVLVSHFNTDYKGAPIPQRTKIIRAMERLQEEGMATLFDPTAHVLDMGVPTALMDLAHYKPAFQTRVAECLTDNIKAAA
jgi:hypothetical protein